MTIILKKGQNIQDVVAKDQRNTAKKGFNAKKYVGKIKFGNDPAEIQKQMRDEWN